MESKTATDKMLTIEELVANVPNEWLPFVNVQLLRNVMDVVFDTTTVENILSTLNYCLPHKIAYVINIPNLNVYKSSGSKLLFTYMMNNGICKPADDAGIHYGDNLKPLAVQGVLIFDSALDGNCRDWELFANDFLSKFYMYKNEEKQYVHCLLWTTMVDTANVLRSLGHFPYLWGDDDTVNFFKVTPRIVWNIMSPIIVFTDGGCTKNGKVGARASYAALLTGGQFGATVVSGEVCPYIYKFADVNNISSGIIPDTNCGISPSNNRGELLGIVYGLLALIRGEAVGFVEIVSDSKISVNTLSTWLPNRIKKGTAYEMKNLDLLMIAWKLLERLRLQCKSVTFTHTHSHTRQPNASAPSRERYIWKGNDMVDKYAGEPLVKKNPSYEISVVTTIPILYSLMN